MKRVHGFLLIILIGFWFLLLTFVPSIRYGINQFFAALPFVGTYFERFTEQYINIWYENTGLVSFLPSLILAVLFAMLWVFNSLYSISTRWTRKYRMWAIRKKTTKHLTKYYFDENESKDKHE